MAEAVVDHYTRALALFGETVREVGDEQWELPTPCPDWDVRSLVAHVVLGEAMIPPLLALEEVSRADIDPSLLGPDPMPVWRGTALAAMEAANALESMDTLVHHPIGDLAADTVLGFRVVDNLVHAWDLATAIGIDLALPGDLAEWCLDFLFPLAGSLGDGEFFAAPLEPPEGAPPGVRLLALLGRQEPAS